MKTVIVRYVTKPDHSDENEALVRAVFNELADSNPDGLRYASFRAADGVTFFHLAMIETEDGSNPLTATAAFKRFQSELRDRCDEPPTATELTRVGSYRLTDA